MGRISHLATKSQEALPIISKRDTLLISYIKNLKSIKSNNLLHQKWNSFSTMVNEVTLTIIYIIVITKISDYIIQTISKVVV